MTNNFTITDLIALAEGFCLFGLFAFIPGYVLGWLLNILQFRRRTLLARMALSTPLSMAFCPLLSYLLLRWGAVAGAWVAFGALWVAFPVLLLASTRVSRRQAGVLAPLALVAGWVVLGAVSLTDIQIGDRLYFSMAALDHCVRTAFTHAISITGVPPQNPLFLAGHPVTLRYHYFWLVVCSLADQLSGGTVGPRQAVIAGTLWCGIGLMALIPLYLRFFDPGGALNLRRRTVAGIALLGVTGLDIIPTALYLLAYSKGLMTIVPSSVEVWNEPVDGWIGTMLWQPHYVAGLTACLMGFLILWHARETGTWRAFLVSGCAAGVAFASAVGTAIYIALAFAIFLAVWTLITLAKKWYRETAVLAAAGLIALLLSLPYLRELSGPGAGGPLVKLTVRSFHPAEIFLQVMQWNQGWERGIVNGLFLPLNYFLEFGFFFAIGCLQWRDYRRRGKELGAQDLVALSMVLTAVAVCTFLRSGVITNNDLGWRGFLIAQFMLLIWGANVLARGKPRAFLTALLVLGAAGTTYDIVMQRAFLMFSDAGAVPGTRWLASSRQVGKRTYANRRAYEWIQSRTPASAVVQQNPAGAFQDTFYLAYGNRRTVAEDTACGTAFGGNPRACEPILARLNNLYSAGGDSAKVEAVCRNLPIDVLVAKDTDAAWNDKHSWVWGRQPAYANDYVRVFTCSRGELASSTPIPSEREPAQLGSPR